MRVADYRDNLPKYGSRDWAGGISSTRARIRNQITLIRAMRADGENTDLAYRVLILLLRALVDLRRNRQVLLASSRVLSGETMLFGKRATEDLTGAATSDHAQPQHGKSSTSDVGYRPSSRSMS